MNRSIFFKNVVFGFGGQFIIIVLGIIIPRILIVSYGSDVNGLISTVAQVFTYMSLLEAGIGQAARNALYGPIIRNDHDGTSYVASMARRYFRKVTLYYAIGVLILSFALPFILKSEVDKLTIFFVVLFEGMAGVVSFYYIETQTMILAADGRGYVNNAVGVVDKTIGYIVKIVMAFLGINIAVFQFAYFLVTIAKVLFYRAYFRRTYPWLDYSRASSEDKLPDRNSYVVTEITWTIFSSTDTIVLSTLLSTQLASVYVVYNMVFSNLSVLMNSLYNSVNYTLGQTYNDDIERYKRIHDTYNSVFVGGMTILMCISYVLILPFVRLYTSGVSDTNYIYPALPVLFCLVQMLSWSRYVSGNLIGVAGHIKKTVWVNITEASINIVLSIVLALHFGIVGVLIATVCALPLKAIYCNIMADKIILQRSMSATVKIIGGNFLFFFCIVIAEKFINLSIDNFLIFITYAILITVIIGLLGILVNIALNPDFLHYIKKIFIKSEK